jgi:hypothetical protein
LLNYLLAKHDHLNALELYTMYYSLRNIGS